ncbi:hypothetical protein TRIP_C20290 [Candidatus Zixiibacteriota bacterium]|nr:hypothetical protein TRIP_C20290 [candidate division Zixibacteria bacterium]
MEPGVIFSKAAATISQVIIYKLLTAINKPPSPPNSAKLPIIDRGNPFCLAKTVAPA